MTKETPDAIETIRGKAGEISEAHAPFFLDFDSSTPGGAIRQDIRWLAAALREALDAFEKENKEDGMELLRKFSEKPKVMA